MKIIATKKLKGKGFYDILLMPEAVQKIKKGIPIVIQFTDATIRLISLPKKLKQ